MEVLRKCYKKLKCLACTGLTFDLDLCEPSLHVARYIANPSDHIWLHMLVRWLYTRLLWRLAGLIHNETLHHTQKHMGHTVNTNKHIYKLRSTHNRHTHMWRKLACSSTDGCRAFKALAQSCCWQSASISVYIVVNLLQICVPYSLTFEYYRCNYKELAWTCLYYVRVCISLCGFVRDGRVMRPP